MTVSSALGVVHCLDLGSGFAAPVVAGATENIAAGCEMLGGSEVRSWPLADVRTAIRPLGVDMVDAFDALGGESRQIDLAVLCLVHRFGGFFLDAAVRLLRRWPTPHGYGIAGYRALPAPEAGWLDIDMGLLWSIAGRPEPLEAARQLAVLNQRRRESTPSSTLPGAGALLGVALARAMTRRGHQREEDQWIGEVRAVPWPAKNLVGYVSADRTLVAFRAAQDDPPDRTV